jgi:multidrug efflux pump subunit AcrA (membrane-fusion protein)
VAQRKSVVIGALYGENVEITSGLSTGDQLIVKGYQNLYEGQIISK